MLKFSLTQQKNDKGERVPWDIVNETHSSNFTEFCNRISDEISKTPANTEKRDCPRFSPGIFTDNKRSGATFIESSLLVLDIDSIQDSDKFFEDINNLMIQNKSFLLFGSPRNSEETPKFRLILPLSSLITDTKKHKYGYEETANSVLKVEGYELDLQCKDSAHFFYIPPSTQKDSIVFNIGEPTEFLCNYDEKVELEKEADLEIRSDALFLAPAEEVRDNFDNILENLESGEKSITNTYGDWLVVCFACVSLRNHFISKIEAFEFFQKFSKLDEGRDNYAQEDIQLRQFNICWEESQDKYSIGTIYKAALDLGWTFPKKYIKDVRLVCENAEQTRFHLAYPNTETDTIIPLYETAFAPSICVAHVLESYPNKFQMKEENVGFTNDKGEFQPLQNPTLLVRNNTKYPKNTSFMLGRDRTGIYYDREADSLTRATHAIARSTPKYSEEVHKFLLQINCKIEWLYTYLVNVTDCTKALPWLYLYGISNGGKSVTVLVIGSLFTSLPDSGFFAKDRSNFRSTAGDSPILWMDEYIPDDATTLKEMVTSETIVVDQKFKAKQTIIGYPRLISSVNADIINLPQDDKTDFSAMVRRVQPIKFTEANKQYLEDIGGKPTIERWIKRGDFRNHIAYVRENPEEFNLIPPSTDIIVLRPYGLQDGDANVYGASSEHKAILEYLLVYVEDKTSKRDSSTTSTIKINEFIDLLTEKRITFKRMAESEIREIIKKAIGVKFQRRVDVNGAKWSIPKDSLEKLREKLGLNDDGEIV